MRALLVTPLTAAMCFLACALALPAYAGPTLGVMPFHVENLALNDAQRLVGDMRAAAAARGYEVQAEATTTQLVESSQALGLDCDVDAVECLVKIGKLADVHFIVVARAVGGLETHVGVDARLIDVGKGVESRRASALLPIDPDQQTAIIATVANALFTVDALPSLTITVEQPGADVIVDGSVRGVSPLGAAVDDLVVGEHSVVVKKPGFITSSARVNVPGDTVHVSLVEDPNSVHTKPASTDVVVPLTVAGIGGAFVVGGVVAAIIGAQPYLAFQQQAALVHNFESKKLDDSTLPQLAAASDAANSAAADWNSWGQTTFISGVIGASLGAVVAVVGGGWWAIVVNADDDAKPAAKAAPAKAP